MSKKFVDAVYAQNGEGDRCALTSSQTKSLERLLKPLCKKLSEYCANFALYQCNMYAVGNEVHMDFAATNINGADKMVSYAVDLETKEMYKGSGAEEMIFNEEVKGKEINKDSEICSSTYDTIVELMKLIPLPVGMISFPTTYKFTSGEKANYKHEKGTILFLLNDDTQDDGDYVDQLLGTIGNKDEGDE